MSEFPKAPPASSDAVRKSMQGNKRRDTKPEIIVRQLLREMGYPGYRLDWKKAHGHPDIAYPGRKIAIYVMGCFWHQHEGCKYASTPKQHTEYWQAKFARNKQRDAEVRAAMKADGWHVVEIWECELKKHRFEDTVNSVAAEIVRNGNTYQCIQTARKKARALYQEEQKTRKEREAALKAELRKD